jgi:hypothetical protein
MGVPTSIGTPTHGCGFDILNKLGKSRIGGCVPRSRHPSLRVQQCFDFSIVPLRRGRRIETAKWIAADTCPAAKKKMRWWSKDCRRAAGGSHLIIRTSWVFAAMGKYFLTTIARIARDQPELRIVADQIGAPTSARTIAETLTLILGAHIPEALSCRFHQAVV